MSGVKVTMIILVSLIVNTTQHWTAKIVSMGLGEKTQKRSAIKYKEYIMNQEENVALRDVLNAAIDYIEECDQGGNAEERAGKRTELREAVVTYKETHND